MHREARGMKAKDKPGAFPVLHFDVCEDTEAAVWDVVQQSTDAFMQRASAMGHGRWITGSLEGNAAIVPVLRSSGPQLLSGYVAAAPSLSQ